MPATHNTSSPTVVLIGGGHCHALALLSLRQRLPAACRIIVINSSPYAVYSGMLPGLINGTYQFSDCQINVEQLCQRVSAEFIDDNVTHIDTAQQLIHTANNQPQAYDILSINVGSSPALNNIAGHQYGYGVKPIAPFLQQWQQWLSEWQANTETKTEKDPPTIVIAGGGAASVELALALNKKIIAQQNLTKQLEPHQTEPLVTLVCGDALLPSHNRRVQQKISNTLAEQNIRVITNQKVVSAGEHSVTLENSQTLTSDFTVWAVNAGAPPWLSNTELDCTKQGFINVDKTLRSTSHPNVFAVGDCCHFSPQPLPKAGVYAVRQAPVLAANIAALVNNKPLQSYQPQTCFLSMLAIGNNKALLSWGRLALKGRWVWRWKNAIDQRFMKLFRH